jgi:hypothetical protein
LRPFPVELETVVLHALEKNPEDRPANAAEFRHELLELTERLGLEYHALILSPDIDALRVAGVESPSGRLVVDISRLREGRMLSSGNNEITLVSPSTVSKTSAETTQPKTFSRMEIGLGRRRTVRNVIIWSVALLLTLSILALWQCDRGLATYQQQM